MNVEGNSISHKLEVLKSILYILPINNLSREPNRQKKITSFGTKIALNILDKIYDNKL